jgi:hypothetical protein
MPFDIRSFNICSWNKSGFADKDKNLLALQYAQSMGCNYVTLDFVLNFKSDGTMVSADSPSSLHVEWIDLEWMIAKAHELGFKVILKPHSSLEGKTQNINGSNTDPNIFSAKNFFAGMNSYLSTLTKVATQQSVEVLCIGTENEIVDQKNRPEWLDLISKVRKTYSGQITYDSHLYDAEKVVFWDALDFISASLYVKLSENDKATKEELMNALVDNNYYSYSSVVNHFASLSREYNKPIVALEAGYDPYEGSIGIKGWQDPIRLKNGRGIDYITQAKGIEAYLEGLAYYGASWFSGVSMWGMSPAEFTSGKAYDPKSPILIAGSYGIESTDLIRSYFTGQSKPSSFHNVTLDGGNHYLGIDTSVAVLQKGSTETNFKIKVTSRIINFKTPDVDVFVDDVKVFTFKPDATPRPNYLDSRGYTWTDAQSFTFTLPKSPNKLVLKLAPTANDSDLYNLSLKSIEINKSIQDIQDGVIHQGQSTPFSSSIIKGSTQIIDIGNYLQSLKNPTTVYGGKGIDLIDVTPISGAASLIKYDDLLKVVQLDLATNNAHSFVTGHDVERIHFTNKNIALDINGNAGSTAKLLGAVFGKDSLTNKQYVGIGLSLLDAGMSTTTLASLAVDAANLKTNDQIVSTLWKNVFGTTATSSDKAPYVKLLDDGMSPGTLAWLAADTTFNKVNINLVGWLRQELNTSQLIEV